MTTDKKYMLAMFLIFICNYVAILKENVQMAKFFAVILFLTLIFWTGYKLKHRNDNKK